jgi:hypothetical protein
LPCAEVLAIVGLSVATKVPNPAISCCSPAKFFSSVE